MRFFTALLVVSAAASFVGCSSTDPLAPHSEPSADASTEDGATPDGSTPDSTIDDSGSDGDAQGDTGSMAVALATLRTYLLGDFDNQAQVASGFSKLVERHVCLIPGRDGDTEVVWLYSEHVEVLSDGRRDSYFTRVNEIRMNGSNVVSKAYKFASGHPLASNAYAYNGPIDGCTQPDILTAIDDAQDLVYRSGCDVTFVPDGDVFHAASEAGTCTFPGGWIQTAAEVTADGIDTTDKTDQGIGDTFEFRRQLDWVYPDAGPP